MQTRIKVITTNNNTKYYIIQKRFDFDWLMLVPLFGWIGFIFELFYEDIIFDENECLSLEEAKNAIDKYYKQRRDQKQLQHDYKTKNTTYIKYP